MKSYLCLLLLIALSPFGFSQTLTGKSYLVAGDSLSDGLVFQSLKKINSEYEKEWWINVDADKNGTTDLEVHYKLYGGNNRDSYILIKPLNSTIQLAHSIRFEESVHETLPVTYTNPYGYTGVYKPLGYTGLEKWIAAFALKDTIHAFSEWTGDLCYTTVGFVRDQARKEWSFSSITDQNYIGFRILKNNQFSYGWMDAKFRNSVLRPASVTQIPKVEKTSGLEVFPNPANQKIVLTNPAGNLLDCSIISLNGSVLQNKKSDSEHIGFDVSNLNRGVYILTVNANNSQVTRMKFIKY